MKLLLATVFCALLITSSLTLAQANGDPLPPPKCSTLTQCKAKLREATRDLNTATAMNKDIAQYNAGLAAKNEELKAENTKLLNQYLNAHLTLRLLKEEFSDAPPPNLSETASKLSIGEDLDFAVSVEKSVAKLAEAFRKTTEHDATAVDKYNNLLADYKDYVQRVGIQLAQANQANRVGNALAIYSLMPKAQPYVLPPVQTFQPSQNLNCVSNRVGDQTYTSCH
jgi:hypothetical protein